MKILWFTNIAMPELSVAMGKKPEVLGGWMVSLLDAIRNVADVELAVATIDPNVMRPATHVVNGVTYYLLPQKTKNLSGLARDFTDACAGVIDAFRPDLIHVHGTEGPYGLFTAQSDCPVPVVLSIQGLIHVYCCHVRGGITLGKSLDGGLAGVLSWLCFAVKEIQWTRRGRLEKQIIGGNHAFIGRTSWDKTHVLAINPSARYLHGEELLRRQFYDARWDIRRMQRYRLFCTAAHSPLKGFHWLLYAVAQLRREFPEIHLRVAGAPWDEREGFGYYGRYIKSLIDKLDLSAHITPLPSLSAEYVATELSRAHAFVLTSLIENSPNSLAEAMLVGTPCVAASVGGVPSMVTDGDSALCFPSCDVVSLVACIRKLFGNDDLAQSLSNRARATAVARHDPQAVVSRQLEIYRQVIAGQGGGNG